MPIASEQPPYTISIGYISGHFAKVGFNRFAHHKMVTRSIIRDGDSFNRIPAAVVPLIEVVDVFTAKDIIASIGSGLTVGHLDQKIEPVLMWEGL